MLTAEEQSDCLVQYYCRVIVLSAMVFQCSNADCYSTVPLQFSSLTAIVQCYYNLIVLTAVVLQCNSADSCSTVPF